MNKPPFTAQFNLGDRVAMAVSYDGSAFHGWQSQRKPQVATVQEALEQALSKIADAPVIVQCAGRTDAGVHASHQIVHFDSPAERGEKAWVSGGNTHLPANIAIHWAKPVPESFHARFSATARRYRYVILNSPARSALLSGGVTWENRPLDEQAMHRAGQLLLGELDFTSYRAVACQSRTPMRNVHFIEVSRSGDRVMIDIQANAFLHHMVRNIAGVLIDIGAGIKPVQWAEEVLLAKDRSAAAVTAPPFGLYLVGVTYPDHFQLPHSGPGPWFLSP
ncbi:tRNA pseudouridine(38-40) synthase TruA [Oceanicoccus sagamiensis]|uniref:tRNA pseudouridine synthase A n=1 Tax=Oceanicoccus sagamiensis TaxID=716816 RepID=A0A1X9ND21_9GAMM|nr:tRNA pseudouridine(38-40) synthase TruA [Oceanicoccus sagamiensis]ARN75930.1 tRNA pseudouridine(38-40) synthase TruA [Oceanicoccus sagamiensis]